MIEYREKDISLWYIIFVFVAFPIVFPIGFIMAIISEVKEKARDMSKVKI